jgi:CRISPR-associated protein Cmr6
VVGLGAESVMETHVALHRTWGVPYIPGTALKGLASSFAHRFADAGAWKKTSGEAHRIVFGTVASQGYVTFLDALPLPGAWRLHSEVMTVHHPEYYGDASTPPGDWDSPNPVSFLSASGRFLIGLAGASNDWLSAVFDLLRRALQDEGIGAKTSSGYGRMALENPIHR